MSESARSVQSNSNADEFYVGYLPMPRRLKKFLIVVIAMLLIALLVGAFVMAGQQSSSGAGHWEYGVLRDFDGVVLAKPYPLLIGPHPFDPTRGNVTYIVVSEGKHGSQARLAPFHHDAVRLKATLLDRDGRFLLELSSAEDAIHERATMTEKGIANTTNARQIGQHTLRGEIIDPKCYLGAMKPGGGRTHRACATLCIRGGIPPMFVTHDAKLKETYYLFTDENGDAILEEIVPFIGEPVELSGEITRIGDLNVLRLRGGSVRRL